MTLNKKNLWEEITHQKQTTQRNGKNEVKSEEPEETSSTDLTDTELEDLMDTGIVTKVRQSSQPHSYSAYRYCGKKTCLL